MPARKEQTARRKKNDTKFVTKCPPTTIKKNDQQGKKHTHNRNHKTNKKKSLQRGDEKKTESGLFIFNLFAYTHSN